jgi:hypothetical protein
MRNLSILSVGSFVLQGFNLVFKIRTQIMVGFWLIQNNSSCIYSYYFFLLGCSVPLLTVFKINFLILALTSLNKINFGELA